MNKQDKRTTILIHIAIWTLMFFSPMMFIHHGENLPTAQYLMMCAGPAAFLLVFYVNYLWLTPRFFVDGERRYYWLINTLMLVCLGIGLHVWIEFTQEQFHPNRTYRPNEVDTVLFVLRNIFNLAIAAAVATAIQLAMRWQQAENARKDAEAARTDAELSNLRSQINPHFLLNTLNNIYALTAFDTERAQQAIQELSRMLRHILYDNQQPFTSLKDEIEFIGNYIQLMKIRLADNVDVRYETPAHIPDVKIAPMILISLVENAFKHGISPTMPSFIHICITTDKDCIRCDITNSNHPKSENDHSGHGIGLRQVQRRLDLTYPNKYEWTKGTTKDNKKYQSTLTLYDTELRNH